MAEPGAAHGDAQLKTLMKLSFILDAAGEGILGKGAPAMMYQAGRDAGSAQRDTSARSDDVDEALALVLTEGDEVWLFERCQDPGREGLWMENGDRHPPGSCSGAAPLSRSPRRRAPTRAAYCARPFTAT